MIIKKIDIHVHAIPEKDVKKVKGGTYPTPDQLRSIYDKIGVEKGLLLPMGGAPECSSDRLSMREARKIVEDNSETFCGWFCNVDPRAGLNSQNTDFAGFLEYYKSVGACGVGEITANLYLDDPRVLNLFNYCQKCKMPVMLHFGSMDNDYGLVDDLGLPRLEKILKEYPRLIIFGHSTRFWSEISSNVTEKDRNGLPKGKILPGGRVVELMREYSNLCCDLSSVSGYNAMTRDPSFTYSFLEEFKDRIFYGTDISDPAHLYSPMLSLSTFIDDAVENYLISQEAYIKICRNNALKIVKGELYEF